jgi:hypothetical protein
MEEQLPNKTGDLTDASSAGESIPGASHQLETTDLVDLLQGLDKCRQIYIAMMADGSNAHLCCSRTISECKQHSKKRLTGKDR